VATFGFLALLYVIWTRVVPIIPVWEVYEGQALQGRRRIGRALLSTRTDSH